MAISLTTVENLAPSLTKLPGYLPGSSSSRRHRWHVAITENYGLYVITELVYDRPTLHLVPCLIEWPSGVYYSLADHSFDALAEGIKEQFRVTASEFIIAVKGIMEPFKLVTDIKAPVLWRNNVH